MKIKHHRHVIISEFENCPRCGETHNDLDFEVLEPAAEFSGVLFTHWAICENKKAPILLRVETQSA